MKSKWIAEKSNIETLLLTENKSFREVGVLYNVSDSHIRKLCLQLSIPISKRRKINPKETFNKGKGITNCAMCGKPYQRYYKGQKYCSNVCSSVSVKRESILKLKEGKFIGKTGLPKSVKEYISEKQEGKCSICGIEAIWNNKPMVFILDHINGKCRDNREENLRCICHNCVSQLDTYKSKNKNSDRTERYKKEV